MKEVLDKAVGFSVSDHFHIDGVVFGSDDFLADIGGQHFKKNPIFIQ